MTVGKPPVGIESNMLIFQRPLPLAVLKLPNKVTMHNE